MKALEAILIAPDDNIRKAINIIDQSGLQIALVVNKDRRLLGVITDGDIRRAILNGISLEEEAHKIMNQNPKTARIDEDHESILKIMGKWKLHHIPIIDEEQRLISLEIIDDFVRPSRLENLVVIMAGGLGERLRPMTNDCPKPLLKVGGNPILETIVVNLSKYGFYKFLLAVNYKAEMIQEYFRDGNKWGIEIDYLKEDKQMGTAGALSLIKRRDKDTNPILVMNGDLLTTVNYKNLLEYHIDHHADATMCVRSYDIEIPFAVVNSDQQKLTSLEEKPVYNYLVNAGIYILENKLLELLPNNAYMDMTEYFKMLISRNFQTIVFPIRESWLDVGRDSDYNLANQIYHQ